VFDMFVCISFMCLRVHVDLIQPLAARNNKRYPFFLCCSRCCTLGDSEHVKIASRIVSYRLLQLNAVVKHTITRISIPTAG